MSKMRFSPGRVLATPGAIRDFTMEEMQQCLLRHLSGDWGDTNPIDAKANDDALVSGARILSSYVINGKKLWVITDAADDDGKRQSTTFLLPSEY